MAILSAGIRNPRRDLYIGLAVTLASFASIAWGLLEMRAAGGEESIGSGLKIGLAIIPAVFGPFVMINFWWGIRVIAALRRGEKVLGRWHISAAQLAAFLPEDAERSRHGPIYLNDWTPPPTPPPEGIDIVFGENGVLAHDTYFTLARTGLYKFSRVGILPHSPLAIEFVTVATHVSSISAITVRRFPAVLRLPIVREDCPEALKVLHHFRQVLAGKVVNPDFYPSRMRFGLTGAAIFLPIAAAGFFLRQGGADAVDLPTLVLIFGGIVGVALLLLALIAWHFNLRQRRKH